MNATRTSLSIAELHRIRQLTANLVNGVGYNLTTEDVKYWNSNTEELHLKLDNLLRRTKDADLVIPYSVQKFDLKIRYDQTIGKLIKAGNYNWVNNDVNSRNFIDKACAVVNTQVYLIGFGKWISSEDALLEMHKYGLEPVTIKVILSFGAQYPNEQKKNSIVALGSKWQGPGGGFGVPILWFVNDERKLSLSDFGVDWDSNYRFLALRK